MQVIHLDITRWTGRAVDTDADDSMAARGAIAIYDQRALTPFGNLRREAVTTISQYGLRMSGLYVVNPNVLPDVVEKLEGIRARWDEVLAKFIAAYPEGCQTWRGSHPEQATYIADKQPVPEDIASRFNFAWYIYEISAVNSAAQASIDRLPQTALDTLRRQLRAVYDTTPLSVGGPCTARTWAALGKVLQTCEVYAWLSSEAKDWAAALETICSRRDSAYAAAQTRRLLGIETEDQLLQQAARLLSAPQLINLEDYI